MQKTQQPNEIAVVGGGIAGLAAALWLARFRRGVQVFDTGSPRNEATWAVHGYPGVADLPPGELRRRLRDQALGAGAAITHADVTGVEGKKDAFRIRLGPGTASARRVLLAYGRKDALPDIPGAREAYGLALFHCPDCDGPSMSGTRVGVIGHDRTAARLALYLLTWADPVDLLAHGREVELDPPALATLRRHGVRVLADPLRRIDATPGGDATVRFDDATEQRYGGLFTHIGSAPGADLAERLGCRRSRDGHIRTSAACETSVPGVYAAGDLTGHPYLAVHAAAEGVTAALAIHRSLLPPDFEL